MKLQDSTLDIVQITIDFICKLVFKDEIKAMEVETQESALRASIYLGAYLKNDNLTEDERSKIISEYKELNPYYKDLLDTKGIQPYISRLGKDLDIISQPEDDIFLHQYLSFYRSLYKDCLAAFYVTTYAQSLVHKDNYRNFCLLCINLMTFLNLMSKWLENPFDIDIMDEKQVDRFMASFGIPYFTKLPIRYKRILAKNLNRLIRTKGTDKVIIDVLDIFDFTEISVFKHYLVKTATTEELEDQTRTRDFLTTDFPKKMQFFSHDIRLPSLNYAVRTNNYRKSLFASTISGDTHWKATESEINQVDFDYVKSKYFSIETGFEISKESMNTVFMLNLLKKIRTDFRVREDLSFNARLISPSPITIEDAILTLQVLTCDYNGVVDLIPYELATIQGVYEFATFDNVAINNSIAIPGVANNTGLVDMRLSEVFNVAELTRIHTKNMTSYNNLNDQLDKETSYKRYKKLKAAYNAKFVQKLNYDMFGGMETYSDYIRSKNTDLYDLIVRIRSIDDLEEQRVTLAETITTLVDVLNSAIDNFKLTLGTTNIDILVGYLKQVIMTFKSFTVSLKDLTVFIVMRDKYQSKLLDYFTTSSTMKFTTDDLAVKDLHYRNSFFDLSDKYRYLERNNFSANSVFRDDKNKPYDKSVFTGYFYKSSAYSATDYSVQTSYTVHSDEYRLNDRSKFLSKRKEHDRNALLYDVRGNMTSSLISIERMLDKHKLSFFTNSYFVDVLLNKDRVALLTKTSFKDREINLVDNNVRTSKLISKSDLLVGDVYSRDSYMVLKADRVRFNEAYSTEKTYKLRDYSLDHKEKLVSTTYFSTTDLTRDFTDFIVPTSYLSIAKDRTPLIDAIKITRTS